MRNALGRALSLAVKIAAAITNLTAAGTGDNTEVDGYTIDTLNDFSSKPEVLGFLFTWLAVLADTKSLTVISNLQDSADGSTWADVVDWGTIVSSTSSGGTTEKGSVLKQIATEKLRRYVRVQFTPNLTASGTDTAKVACTAIAGGLAVE